MRSLLRGSAYSAAMTWTTSMTCSGDGVSFFDSVFFESNCR